MKKTVNPLKKTSAAFLLVFALLSAAIFPACTQSVDYFSFVSELRSDVFCGENENFSASVYSGFKEKPFCHDGEIGETKLMLTVKLFEKQKIDEEIEIKIEFGGDCYEKSLNYDPVSRALSCDLEVNSLPEKTLNLTVCYGETTAIIELKSKLNENTVSYTVALESANRKAAEFLKQNTTNGKFNGEISIRLLCENDRNYYYVGYILESGLKAAYLIDGASGEVLAEKKL